MGTVTHLYVTCEGLAKLYYCSTRLLTACTAKCVHVATILKTVNPSTRWAGVVSVIAQLLYSWERALTVLSTGGVVGPTAGLDSLDIPQMYCSLPSHCVYYYDLFP